MRAVDDIGIVFDKVTFYVGFLFDWLGTSLIRHRRCVSVLSSPYREILNKGSRAERNPPDEDSFVIQPWTCQLASETSRFSGGAGVAPA
jgi:hypothetical protein